MHGTARDLERREAKRHDDASEEPRCARSSLERREAKRHDDASEVSVHSERRDPERHDAERQGDARPSNQTRKNQLLYPPLTRTTTTNPMMNTA